MKTLYQATQERFCHNRNQAVLYTEAAIFIVTIIRGGYTYAVSFSSEEPSDSSPSDSLSPKTIVDPKRFQLFRLGFLQQPSSAQHFPGFALQRKDNAQQKNFTIEHRGFCQEVLRKN